MDNNVYIYNDVCMCVCVRVYVSVFGSSASNKNSSNERQKFIIYISYAWYFLFYDRIEVFFFMFVWLVWFYGISTIAGYLMPNPLYTYVLNIYDLVWLGFMAYQLL